MWTYHSVGCSRRDFDVSSFLFVLFAAVALVFFQLQRLFGTQKGFTPSDLNTRQSSKPKSCTNVSLPSELVGLDELLHKKNMGDVASITKQCESLFHSLLEAFASAHHKTLKKYLSKDVYESFAQQIEKREARNLILRLEVRDIKATLKSYHATRQGLEVTVEFSSEQMLMTVNPQGESFDNPAQIFIPKVDMWTFDLRPGKILVLETKSGGE